MKRSYMKNVSRALLTMSALFVTTSALAAPGWRGPVQITGYFVYENGFAFIKTTNNGIDCSNNNYIAFDTSTTNFKAIWAQVIAAHATQSTVSVNMWLQRAGVLGWRSHCHSAHLVAVCRPRSARDASLVE